MPFLNAASNNALAVQERQKVRAVQMAEALMPLEGWCARLGPYLFEAVDVLNELLHSKCDNASVRMVMTPTECPSCST